MNFLSKDELGNIGKWDFNCQDVLTNEGDKIRRQAQLIKAVTLESLNQTEVILSLEHATSCKKIRTRIIAAADDRVMLDMGHSIPIRCIHKVDFL